MLKKRHKTDTMHIIMGNKNKINQLVVESKEIDEQMARWLYYALHVCVNVSLPTYYLLEKLGKEQGSCERFPMVKSEMQHDTSTDVTVIPISPEAFKIIEEKGEMNTKNFEAIIKSIIRFGTFTDINLMFDTVIKKDAEYIKEYQRLGRISDICWDLIGSPQTLFVVEKLLEAGLDCNVPCLTGRTITEAMAESVIKGLYDSGESIVEMGCYWRGDKEVSKMLLRSFWMRDGYRTVTSNAILGHNYIGDIFMPTYHLKMVDKDLKFVSLLKFYVKIVIDLNERLNQNPDNVQVVTQEQIEYVEDLLDSV